MPELLPATRTRVPLVRRPFVTRQRLLARLDAASSCPLTLLAAPPGFGKTSLLADWIDRSHRRSGWVSLDESGNDPARFWAYLVRAHDSVSPGFGKKNLDLFFGPELASTETVLTSLINRLDALPDDAIVVLDDYHVIENPQIHSAILLLIARRPAQAHLFLATRGDPPLPLGTPACQGATQRTAGC